MTSNAELISRATSLILEYPPAGLPHWQRVGATLKAAGIAFEVFSEWSWRVDTATLARWHRDAPSKYVRLDDSGWTLHSRQWWKDCAEVVDPPDVKPLFDAADRRGACPGHWHDDGGLAATWSAGTPALDHWRVRGAFGLPFRKLRVKPESVRVRCDHRSLQRCLMVALQDRVGGEMSNLLLIEDAESEEHDYRVRTHLLFPDRPGYLLLGELDSERPLLVCNALEDGWACHWAGQHAVAVIPQWEQAGEILADLSTRVQKVLLLPSGGVAGVADELVWHVEAEQGLAADQSNVHVSDLFCADGPGEMGAHDMLTRQGRAHLKNGISAALLKAGDAGATLRFKLLGSADLAALAPMAWRVAGVLPTAGLAGLYGPSGSGKSFLALDLATAIAEGRQWFGLHTQAAPVVYVALEGEAGFRARVAAWEARHGRPLPDGLRLVLQAFKLTEPGDVADLAAAAPAGALIVIDTLNRAAPHADENSSRDMGDILEAAKHLQSATGGLVLLVHHTGKDASRGMRGHSSLIAALDAAVEVWREGEERRWRVTKAKDGAEGEDRQFALQTEILGLDIHGDAITSCVVADLAQGTRDRMSRGCRVALDALRVALERDGAAPVETVKARLGSLAPAKVLTEEAWRQATYQEGIAEADAEQDSKRRAFSRARNQLLDLSLVGTFDGYVWVR